MCICFKRLTNQVHLCIRFWPAIDSAIREAACTRGVEVNLLVSCWSHSPGSMFLILQSLTIFNRSPLGCNINVVHLLFPFLHAKYMVTDRVVYIHHNHYSLDKMSVFMDFILLQNCLLFFFLQYKHHIAF